MNLRVKTVLNFFLGLFLCQALSPLVARKAEDKPVVVLYESKTRLHRIALDGIQTKIKVKALDLAQAEEFKECDRAFALAIAIGKPALDKGLEYCRSTPVLFSLVSAPRFFDYKKHNHLTGVSFDLSYRLFLSELKKVLPEGSRIGFIYSSEINNFLTAEMDYVESEFGFTGIRVQAESREQMGPRLKALLETDRVQALWVMPDPLYTPSVFKKLADVCREKKVLLITNFEALVRESGAALALAPNYFDTGVQTAELALRVLAGRAPVDLPYERPRQFGVYVNLKLFEQLGIELPVDLKYKDRVTTLLDEGQDLLKAEKPGEALKLFREALKLDKKNPTAQYFVNSLTAQENYAAALGKIRNGNRLGALPLLIAASPFLSDARQRLQALRSELYGNATQIFERGVQQFRSKRYKECIQSMNLVLMIIPNHKEAEIYKEKATKRAKAVSAIQ